MFHTLLSPEQVKPVSAAYVQDMGKADWDQPRGNWIPAKEGFYVLGSKRHGSMGPTIASFAQEADAKKFIGQWGGNSCAMPKSNLTWWI
jgi:copper chaperone NosL